MIKVKQFEFSDFGVNTYVVTDEATNECAIIDPAMSDNRDRLRFETYIKDNALTVTQIINTHLHLDHCFGLTYVKDKYGVDVKAHADDAPLGRHMGAQLRRFGIRSSGDSTVEIDTQLADGDIVRIGQSSLEVIHVPGHSPGSIALYSAEAKLLFSGDTLFRQSVGRTDLYGGSQQALADSIRRRLYSLPGDTTVLPGHGPSTTIAHEISFNPFV